MAKRSISVIDYAGRQEEYGMSFYTTAAEKFGGTELAGLFLKLAKEEAKHLRNHYGLLPNNKSSRLS